MTDTFSGLWHERFDEEAGKAGPIASVELFPLNEERLAQAGSDVAQTPLGVAVANLVGMRAAVIELLDSFGARSVADLPSYMAPVKNLLVLGCRYTDAELERREAAQR